MNKLQTSWHIASHYRTFLDNHDSETGLISTDDHQQRHVCLTSSVQFFLWTDVVRQATTEQGMQGFVQQLAESSATGNALRDASLLDAVFQTPGIGATLFAYTQAKVKLLVRPDDCINVCMSNLNETALLKESEVASVAVHFRRLIIEPWTTVVECIAYQHV